MATVVEGDDRRDILIKPVICFFDASPQVNGVQGFYFSIEGFTVNI